MHLSSRRSNLNSRLTTVCAANTVAGQGQRRTSENSRVRARLLDDLAQGNSYNTVSKHSHNLTAISQHSLVPSYVYVKPSSHLSVSVATGLATKLQVLVIPSG